MINPFKKCVHEWIKQSESTHRSNYGPLDNIDSCSPLLYERIRLSCKGKHIVILTCSKCGKIYESVERIP